MHPFASCTFPISIRALRVEGNIIIPHTQRSHNIFQSASSVWRATTCVHTLSARLMISIHALRVEGDHHRHRQVAAVTDFYPRPPCGGRLGSGRFVRCGPHFYPRPPCGGRPVLEKVCPHESSFLPTPSVWRATTSGGAAQESILFLSTPSVWRATYAPLSIHSWQPDFYPRPPCGGRLASTIFKEHSCNP